LIVAVLGGITMAGTGAMTSALPPTSGPLLAEPGARRDLPRAPDGLGHRSCCRAITPSTGLTEKRAQMSAVSRGGMAPVPAIVMRRGRDDQNRRGVSPDQEEAGEDQHAARVDGGQPGAAEAIDSAPASPCSPCSSHRARERPDANIGE